MFFCFTGSAPNPEDKRCVLSGKTGPGKPAKGISVLRICELLQFLLSRQHIPHNVGYVGIHRWIGERTNQDCETKSAANNQTESIWLHEFQCRETSKLISNHLLGMVIPLQTACFFSGTAPIFRING